MSEHTRKIKATLDAEMKHNKGLFGLHRNLKLIGQAGKEAHMKDLLQCEAAEEAKQRHEERQQERQQERQ
jgi:hypothetical protein